MPRRFVVENASILTQNERREVVRRGSVLVEDGRIVRVSASRIDAAGAEVVNGEGMALMPGLVNAHAHVMCILLRGGLGADRRLMDWRLNVMAPGQTAYAPGDAALAARLFACEAIRSGATTVATNERVPIPLAEAMIEAMEDSGLRSVFALSFNEIPPEGKLAARARSHLAAWGKTFPPGLKSREEIFGEISHLAEKYHGRAGGARSRLAGAEHSRLREARNLPGGGRVGRGAGAWRLHARGGGPDGVRGGRPARGAASGGLGAALAPSAGGPLRPRERGGHSSPPGVRRPGGAPALEQHVSRLGRLPRAPDAGLRDSGGPGRGQRELQRPRQHVLGRCGWPACSTRA